MKIFCWNCRGLGAADDPTIPFLLRSARQYHPPILFLQETLTTIAQASSRTPCLGLPNFCGVDSIGRSGGLLLRWDNSVVLTPISLDPHYIFCNIAISKPPCKNHVMYVLFIYGEARFEYRQSLWNRITALISGVTPLLLMGDFNQIELFSDKLGGTSVIRGQRDFIAWKFSHGLVDLPFFGPRFTWMNDQLHSATIFERLDRAYANQDWCQLFPNASITNLPIFVSDHAPIILSMSPETSSRRRPYRIDNWCLNHPEVKQLVPGTYLLLALPCMWYHANLQLHAIQFCNGYDIIVFLAGLTGLILRRIWI
ncbi:uncharacterized protein LOC141607895 [Silene latifolia]|uniref:uncharacterized protein LOC141607895 n=1 Tax=Silene latifolia TaxID=37657 RepID=UPI003D77657B